MTKKRKIINTVLIILWVLLCGYRVFSYFKEKHDIKVMYEQAYSNARQNIRDKYGFTPDLYESELNERANSIYAEHGYIFLTAKYDGKEFQVLSNGMEKDPVSLDNYQYDEIKSALLDEVSKEFPGGKYVECDIYEFFPWKETAFGYAAFKTFYDGDNLDEVLGDGFGNISVAFADTKFTDVKVGERLQKMNIDFEFTSFDTEEHLEKFCQKPSGRYIDQYDRFKMFAPYITDHYEIKDGEVKRLDFKFQEYSDFMYSYFPAENWDFPVSEDMTVKEGGYVSQMYWQYGEGEYVSKPLTNEYYFDCRYGDIYVYYPLDVLKDYDLENIGAAWYSRGGQTNNRDMEKLTVCGDYAVFSLPFDETSFMLVDTSGFEEYVPEWKKEN